MNKDKLVVAGLMQLMKLLIGSGVLNDIKKLVQDYWLEDLSGDEKKSHVTADLKALTSNTGVVVKGIAGWALSTAIDVVHAYLAVNSQ